MATPSPRPSALRRLGRFCYRRHWPVIIAWIVGIFVLGGIAGAVGDGYSDSFGDFESEATQGFDMLEEGFGNAGENNGTIVFPAEQGVDDPEVQAAMEELFAGTAPTIEGLQVVVALRPWRGAQIVQEGPLAGQLAYATVVLPGDIELGRHRQARRRGRRAAAGRASPATRATGSASSSAARSSPSSSRPSPRSSASASPSSS